MTHQSAVTTAEPRSAGPSPDGYRADPREQPEPAVAGRREDARAPRDPRDLRSLHDARDARAFHGPRDLRDARGPRAAADPRGKGSGGGRGTREGGVTHGPRGNGVGPLTGLGVSLVLALGCGGGALLDLLLVGGPAWALIVLYLSACGYTAAKVRRADWFAALVGPPLAFASAMILLAMLMPSSFGPGLLGVAATTFELLASKAKALYLGAALSAGLLLVRRLRRPRN
jgi:hypothetical protein